MGVRQHARVYVQDVQHLVMLLIVIIRATTPVVLPVRELVIEPVLEDAVVILGTINQL